MDEESWQLSLLKTGVHITNIDMEHNLVYFDFAYRPYGGGPRVWGKSVLKCHSLNGAALVVELKDAVLELRKGLEGRHE